MAGYVDERGDRVSSAEANKTVNVSEVEARQGLLGRPVLMVLIGGLALALIAWAGAEIFGESTDNDAATQVQQNAPATNADDAVPANQGTVDNTPADGQPMQSAPANKEPAQETGTGG